MIDFPNSPARGGARVSLHQCWLGVLEMNKLRLAALLLLALASPAYADMYPDASNAKLPDAQTNLKAAPHVATNVALAASATTLYPSGVWRDDFASGNGAPPLWYQPSGSPCSLAAGNGDNGSQVKSADSKCWLAQFPTVGGDIREWGAVCKGGDDTASVNAAFASGINPVLWPPLSCTVTTLNSPPPNFTLLGQGEYASTIVTSSATGDVLPIINGNVIVSSIGFNSSTTRTAGYYVHLKSINLTLNHFYMQNAFGAVAVDDGVSISIIDHGYIYNSVGSGQAVVKYGSGTATGPVATYFGHTIINSATPTYTAVSIANVGDFLMDNVEAIGATVDVALTPGSGQVVATFKCAHSFGDHGGTGWLLQPSGTGTIVRAQFTDCWSGTTTQNGFNLNGGTGAGIDGVQFVNCQAVDVQGAGSGIAIQGNTKHISWVGGVIAENGDGVFDSRSSGFNDVKFIGAQIGAGNGFTGNTTGIVLGGAGDYLVLQNNNIQGNTTAMTGASGAHNRIVSNDGVNPAGNLVQTVGASPWTMPQSPYPATAYVYAGTISNISVNGTQYFSAAASPAVVPLAPGDVMTITYTVAPMVNLARQ